MLLAQLQLGAQRRDVARAAGVIEAIEQLAGLAREVRDVAFARCDSLYYASCSMASTQLR